MPHLWLHRLAARLGHIADASPLAADLLTLEQFQQLRAEAKGAVSQALSQIVLQVRCTHTEGPGCRPPPRLTSNP